MSRRLATVALTLVALLLPIGLPLHAAAAEPDVWFERLAPAGTLRQPLGIVPDTPGGWRVFVLEREGLVRTYDPRSNRFLSTPMLDIRSLVHDSGGEQGLLGMALDPRFRSGRPYAYVAFTDTAGSLRVERYTFAASTQSLVVWSRKLVLRVPHPTYTNHNGGQLLFSGGMLLISTGDGGGSGDPDRNALDRRRLLGKILRIDVSRTCGTALFCIPPDNPYATSTTFRREIWAYGLRNPWRVSADRATSELWIADVGQGRYEEVSVLGRAQRGANLGWSCREGPVTYDASRCSGLTGLVGPRLAYAHGPDTGASVTGGYVYRGRTYQSQIGGRYVLGDFVSGRVWRTTTTPGSCARSSGCRTSRPSARTRGARCGP